jgi:hypothetical protein
MQHELLDRTLIRKQSYLRRILHQYETHHNQHRPHRSLDAAALLKSLPKPVDLEHYRIRRQARVSTTINEYLLVAWVDETSGTHRCCQRRRRRLGTFQPVPTPARCRARQASPTSSKLVGANTALVAVLVAFSRNAITNIMAPIMASIRFPSGVT